ncbi:hypothetical protein OO012_11275 [Rhodobacteraceae bacterium KMM 6894]|nr:hypothetical protein [Rhodobacteraceae bacterium KMM 6894]
MPPRYIVVATDLFVSEDLCEILRTVENSVLAVAVSNLSGACNLLSDGAPVDIVFLNGSAAQTQDVQFLALVQARGAFLVRIGGPMPLADTCPHSEVSIPAPFTNEVITALLEARRVPAARV